MDAMIDAALGVPKEPSLPPKLREPNDEEKAAARFVAYEVVDYITRMYPAMFTAAPKSARLSIRRVTERLVAVELVKSADAKLTDEVRRLRAALQAVTDYGRPEGDCDQHFGNDLREIYDITRAALDGGESHNDKKQRTTSAGEPN